jgi:hypothetical protein
LTSPARKYCRASRSAAVGSPWGSSAGNRSREPGIVAFLIKHDSSDPRTRRSLSANVVGQIRSCVNVRPLHAASRRRTSRPRSCWTRRARWTGSRSPTSTSSSPGCTGEVSSGACVVCQAGPAVSRVWRQTEEDGHPPQGIARQGKELHRCLLLPPPCIPVLPQWRHTLSEAPTCRHRQTDFSFQFCRNGGTYCRRHVQAGRQIDRQTFHSPVAVGVTARGCHWHYM